MGKITDDQKVKIAQNLQDKIQCILVDYAEEMQEAHVSFSDGHDIAVTVFSLNIASLFGNAILGLDKGINWKRYIKDYLKKQEQQILEAMEEFKTKYN